MRKIILLCAMSVMLFSCGKDDAVKDKVIGEIKSNMKDPASFELVDYKAEEVTFKDAEMFLSSTQELIAHLSGEQKERSQKKYDFVKSGGNDNDVAYYTINLTVKGNNSYGQAVESKYTGEVLNNDAKDVVFLMTE